MVAAIRREIMITKLFRKEIAAICLLAPVVIRLIPYWRQLGNRTELELKLLGLAGLIGASAYMVFYISYYAIKCERECKSLERAISTWGISKLIFSKSIVIGGMGILCEILFLLIFGFLSNGLKLASWELLGIIAINMFVFAWLGNVLMCIADGIFSNLFVALVPTIQVTFALMERCDLYGIFVMLELLAGGVTFALLKRNINDGRVEWL